MPRSKRSSETPPDFEYLGDYVKASLWGTQDLVTRLINLLSLIGIALMAAITFIFKLDLASFVVLAVASVILVIATHYGSFVAYQRERRERESLEERLERRHVALRPVVGLRDHFQDGDYLMWADLIVKNESNVPLLDVEIRLERVRNVFLENRGGEKRYWWSHVRRWSPVNVVWSRRNALPNTLRITIPADEERTASIAYCNDSNGNGGFYSLPNDGVARLQSGVNQVSVSVSSPDGLSHKEHFYLQCHPNYWNGPSARFEFELWDEFFPNSGIPLIEEMPHVPGLTP